MEQLSPKQKEMLEAAIRRAKSTHAAWVEAVPAFEATVMQCPTKAVWKKAQDALKQLIKVADMAQGQLVELLDISPINAAEKSRILKETYGWR
jgi:hypothetical protein